MSDPKQGKNPLTAEEFERGQYKGWINVADQRAALISCYADILKFAEAYRTACDDYLRGWHDCFEEASRGK